MLIVLRYTMQLTLTMRGVFEWLCLEYGNPYCNFGLSPSHSGRSDMVGVIFRPHGGKFVQKSVIFCLRGRRVFLHSHQCMQKYSPSSRTKENRFLNRISTALLSVQALVLGWDQDQGQGQGYDQGLCYGYIDLCHTAILERKSYFPSARTENSDGQHLISMTA